MKKQILMCPPQYFDIEYEINPWMHQDDQVNTTLAMEEWDKLKQTYLTLDCEVFEQAPQKGWPDLVFTANAGLLFGEKKMILSNFRYPDRQGEAKFDEHYFKENGFEVIQPLVPFEGQGEAFVWNGKILAGFGFRSTEKTAAELEKISGLKVVQLELIDPRFYHLDMALSPITSDLIVYNPKAFSQESIEKIKSLGCELIDVTQHDADMFAANLVPVGKTIVMIEGTENLANEFRSRGFETIELNMSEFRKSGGAIRCLTLDLNFP
jgi:N-dimethylarginine dimethylaminohydrolase